MRRAAEEYLLTGGYPAQVLNPIGGELDFVLGSRARPLPVDVRYETVSDGELRCYGGMRLFIRRFPQTREAVVVTRNEEQTIQIDRTKVRAVSLWKFLWDGGGLKLR